MVDRGLKLACVMVANRFLPEPPGSDESPSSAILTQVTGKLFTGLWRGLEDALEVSGMPTLDCLGVVVARPSPIPSGLRSDRARCCFP